MARPWNLEPSVTRRWRRRTAVAAWCALAFLASGCRAVDNAQVDVMERELRMQEDKIYELEGYLMEYSEKLRDCRLCQPEMTTESTSPSTSSTRSSAKPEPTLAIDPPRSTSRRSPSGGRIVPPIEDADIPPDAFDAPPVVVPPIEPPVEPATAPESAPLSTPEATPIDPAELEDPGLEIGPTSELQWKGAAPIATTPPGSEAPPYIPDPADYQTEAEPAVVADAPAVEAPQLIAAEQTAPSVAIEATAEPMLPPATDGERLTAQRLKIQRIFGNAPAEDTETPGSLLVVVEALNATDEPVDANGTASLMVTRGATQEDLQPIDRWDFTAEETQAAWQSSQLGDGLHLELPLHEVELPEGPIYLWVRLVSADGANLRARVIFSASELAPLDAGAVEAAALAEQEAAADQGGEALVTTTPAAADAVAEATTASAWRASSEPLSIDRVEAYSTTVGSAAGQWTSQPPGGRAPLAATPRVASASDAPPRWQQGSGEAPASDRDGAWAPFR